MNDFINHMIDSKKRLAGLDPKDNPWVIKHNGVIVERAGTQDRAMQKLIQIQDHSIWEATRKDGYTIENEPVNEKTNFWDVYLNGKKIDTVTDTSDDPEAVKRALVDHDGYDPGIEVKLYGSGIDRGVGTNTRRKGGAVDDAIGFLRKQWGDEEIVDHIMHDWRLDQANAQQVLAQAKQRVNKETADHGLASPVESKTVTGVLRLLKSLKEGVIKSFWVVTKPSMDSTMEDICFEATPQSLMNQAKGGLRTDELVAVYDNEKEAKIHADGLLKTRTTEGKVPDDADPEDKKIAKLTEDKKIAKLTEDGRDPEDKIEDKPDGEDGPDVKRPEDPANPTPAEGEEQEKDTITKEYIGKKEETHFYMVGTPSNTPSSEEGADTPDDLQIVDQEGKKLWSASEQEIDPSDPANFIMQAIQELEIDEITRSVLVKYILPKMTEEDEEEGPEEVEAEEPTEDVDAASGKPDEELPAGEERKNPFERKLRTGSKIAERCAARKAKMLKEDHDEAAWDGIIKAIEDKDSKYEAVVTLMAEVWNGGFEQWIDNGIAEEEGRLAIRMLRKIGTDSANKMADLAEEAMKSDFYEMAVVDRNIQDPENDYEENAEELSKLDDQFYGGLDDQLVKDLAAKLGVGKAAEATEAKVNESADPKGLKAKLKKALAGMDWLGTRADDKWTEEMGETFFETMVELLSQGGDDDAAEMERLLHTEEDAEQDLVSDLVGMVSDDFMNFLRGRKKTPKRNEAKVPDDADAEDTKIKKLIETKVQMGDDTFTVYQVDDGTDDTVIDINGQEYRFEKDFAAMWRDEATGELTADGLQELALDALSNMGEDEYAQLVSAGDKRSQDQIDADEEQRVRDIKADQDYDSREEQKLMRAHENESKVEEHVAKTEIDVGEGKKLSVEATDIQEKDGKVVSLTLKLNGVDFKIPGYEPEVMGEDWAKDFVDEGGHFTDQGLKDLALDFVQELTGDEWEKVFGGTEMDEKKKMPAALKKHMFRKKSAKKDDGKNPYKNESTELPSMRGKRNMDLLKGLLGMGQ